MSKENQQTGEVALKFGLSVKIDGNLWQKCNLKQESSCSLPNFWQGKNSKSLLAEKQFPLFFFLDKLCSCSIIRPEGKARECLCSFGSVWFPLSFPGHSVVLRMLNWVRRWNSSLQAKTSEEPVCCPQHHSRLAFPPTTSLQLFSYFPNLRSMSLKPQLPEMQPIDFCLNLLIELCI